MRFNRLLKTSVPSAQSVVRKDCCAFLRNEPANPTEYFSERPEMSSQWREVTEGQNKKTNKK